MSKKLRFAFLWQGVGPSASMDCPWRLPRRKPFQQPAGVGGGRCWERTLPVRKQEQRAQQTEVGLWNPPVLGSSPTSDASQLCGLWTSHLISLSQVNGKQKCPNLGGTQKVIKSFPDKPVLWEVSLFLGKQILTQNIFLTISEERTCRNLLVQAFILKVGKLRSQERGSLKSHHELVPELDWK